MGSELTSLTQNPETRKPETLIIPPLGARGPLQMTICIISHTEHYIDQQNQIVGWGPTVTEINHLAKDYIKIYHLAFLYTSTPPESALPYTSSNIEFVALPVSGGASLFHKLSIVFTMPKNLGIINSVLKKVDAFQFRTPIGFGVYLIPYLSLFSSKKGWYKYAGNWNQKNAPLGYRLQRFFLRNQKRKVTINGNWPKQPAHCLSFENPCLTDEERVEGMQLIQQKSFRSPHRFCFVGRLEDEKGVQRIIDAISNLNTKAMVECVAMIGDGENRQKYENEVEQKGLPIQFHGFQPRQNVIEFYKKSHFLLLPSSASEGFPKVIAEAMNYGCIPMVSDVSSIGQYINDSNGFIVSPNLSETLQNIIKNLSNFGENQLKQKAEYAYQISKDFTFKHYRNRIKKEILDL